MKFIKLRLLGFKSFVEPTEFLIEDGLTGVVGPNGCGKSNLVEALRWVMGENSYKNMRASGMDDVIFSGSGNRPARNTAEVGLFLDNTDRTAPAMFNDADELQVTRRIEREAGSVYRINGREVRARDVQLLFADASTGARSPSMVGQGRIGELISAKPQARRALLEEAAGISGLHSRRHEAELRLRGAEQNLERLEDVLAQMESQVENLKRQSRQANRYRALSAEIRRAEALLLHLRWTAAKTAEAEAQSALSAAALEAGKRAEAQAQAAKDQAVIAAGLPGLREEEAKAAAALQRLRIARDHIDAEAKRIDERRRDLEGRIHQLDADMARERRMLADNAGTLERLAAEEAELLGQGEGEAVRAAGLHQAVEAAAARVAASENAFAELTGRSAQEKARKQQIERTMRDMADRARRVAELAARAARDLADLAARDGALAGLSQFRERVELLEKRADDCEADAISAEKAAEAARQREQEARAPLASAEAESARIATEAKTLARILSQGGQGRFPGIVERLRVAPGYEAALGAALGEDLDAPADAAAPAHWRLVEAEGDPELPEGVRALSGLVQGPAELARRLAQTGLCARADGPALQLLLKPGQRIVSREGDLWRWDGFVSGAEAPSAAAQRLAQKNRLAELEAEAQAASVAVDKARAFFEAAKSATAAAIDAERKGREAWRAVQHDLAAAREELARAEREATQFAARKAQLEETRDRLAADLAEAQKGEQEARAQLDSMPDPVALESELERSRAVLTVERSQLAQARAEAEGLARETAARERRLAAIAQETAAWRERAANAEKHVATLAERMETARAELRETEDAPGLLAEQRRALAREIEQADNWRAGAAAELAQAEAAQAEADRRARDTLADLSAAREERVRAEERAAAAAGRREEAEARIREELECHPADALKLAERAPGAPLPAIEPSERDLERLKADRERLGPVNLRAEVEQAEIQAQRDALVAERDDLVEAIKRLRAGIASLNREGRERLLEAFDVVNAQFQRLFGTLFGGGTAELQLIESDDPLEAGLEILARPPGKKPQTMTLLSGGEQALTAMALIFAVFLTNPAPICVLDEVDAPLDDHNVERFCNLMDEMAATTSTRFLIITHNPITMARMNRLFGVTMAERGVSQLVSVDLQQAEKMREAG